MPDAAEITDLLKATMREVLAVQCGTTGGALTVDDAAEYLGMGRTSLYKLVGEGKLTPRSNGVRPIFLRRQLDEYLSQCPTNETPTARRLAQQG
ncbi:MAG: helix-turn-helix domain-containing protein [Acidobacteriota bacterium]